MKRHIRILLLALAGMLALAVALRPHRARAQAAGVTADIRSAPIEDALAVVLEGSGRALAIAPEAAKKARPVTLSVRDRPAEEAARLVARAAGVPVTLTEKSVTVGSAAAPDVEEVSDLTPPVLETQVYGQTKFLPGALAALRVVALRHAGEQPVPNAQVRITLTRPARPGPNGQAGFARALFTGRTDATGTVSARFAMPNLPAGSYGLSITTAALGERDHLAQNISLAPSAQVLLTTDKPVYQPGQVIHIRALALSDPDRSPVAGAEAVIEVADGKGNKVFKRREKSSVYGIVSADFQLADEVNMGAYKVSATVGPATQEKTVTVERYVLPKYKVEFAPDQTWYRPGDTLSGVVSAQYFFGKPVGGTVKVILSSFDAGFSEFATVTGTLDATGHFRLQQKLPGFFAGQPLEQGNAFVKADIVVTDTADHAEKATKSVAIAAAPIKVTVVPESPAAVPNVTNRAYVVTSYPDGTPAAAGYRAVLSDGQGGSRTISGETDASGVGLVAFEPAGPAVTLTVTAQDKQGRTGQGTADLSGGEDGILLRADRALYKVGDTLHLSALSPASRSTIYFDVVRERQTVLTRSADLKDGRADVSLDLGSDLTGTLEVHAYRIGKDGNIRRDTRVVYVDPANDLKVVAAPDKETYLPGEGAKVRFTVTDAAGRPRPAALGVAIVDESVFALQEMQPGMEKVYFMLEKEILEPRYEIHGITPEEIVRPTAGPVAPVRQRAAGALFASLPRHDAAVSLLGNSYPQKQMALVQRAYSAVVKDAEAVRQAILAYQKGHGGVPPVSGDLLVRLVQDGRLKQRRTRDPWKHPYSATAVSASYKDGFTLKSDGPDGRPNTDDDLAVYARLETPVEEQTRWFFSRGDINGPFVRGRGGVLRVDALVPQMPVLEGRAAGVMLEVDRMMLKSDTMKAIEAPAASAGSAAPAVRVREYFPETLLFAPALITDSRGVATLDVPMADSITTWRLTATASSRAGSLGSVTAPMRAFQDFFVDVNFPVQLTQGDEVSVPVSVYNYLPRPQTVTLIADKEGWFELLGDAKQTVTLGPNEVKGVRFRIRTTGLGFQKLTVRAQGTSRADAVRREVEVIPNGKRVEQAYNGRLTENVHQVVHIPETSVTGAANILVKVYPGLFSTVLEGMDNIFRMPFGCFEQTSSVTYPNVLVLDYMKRTKRITPEIQMKAEQYVNLGYQRLLSYEVEGGGFSWFGNAPANKVLTAYGLQEFADMSAVWEVDPAMIARTRAWLSGQQNADGSWSPDANYIDEGLGPMWKDDLLSTAYVLWGMAESGKGQPGLSGENTIVKAVNYVKAHMDAAKDPYALAILANALASAAPDDPATKTVLDRLLASRTDEGDKTYWQTGQSTVTFASGDSATVETTALAAFALIRGGVAPDVVTRAMNYLISKRDPSGTWGTTQATIMTLRAMVAGLGAQVRKGSATVRVLVNGSEAGVIQVTPDNADVMQQVDAKSFVHPGDNDVELSVSGEGQMMYGISAYHYVPWTAVREEKGPIAIQVKYDRTTLARDETLTCSVSVAFNPAAVRPVPAKAANMVVVDLGIPPGFTVEPDDLKGLVDRKIADRYETTGRQVILYFEKIEAGKPLSFDLRMRAQYPLRAKTPKSVAYEYYDPQVRAEAAPVSLEVTEG